MSFPLHVRQRIAKRDSRLRRLGYPSYMAYTQSPEWEAAKQRYRDAGRPQKCICGGEPTIFHHQTYERVGEEWPEDLILLCQRCHDIIHLADAEVGYGLSVSGLRSEARRKPYQPPEPRKPQTRAEWIRYRFEKKRAKQAVS